MGWGANESIRNRLAADPKSKWGFVMYRCTYSSDSKWNEFMEYFKAVVRADLERGELSDCFDRLDWNVREDPEYEGMENYQARRWGSPSNNTLEERIADMVSQQIQGVGFVWGRGGGWISAVHGVHLYL